MGRSSTTWSVPSWAAEPRDWEASPPIPDRFYLNDAAEVARTLLGKFLVVGEARTRTVSQIVEVEAYLGEKDPASHAYSGLTPRNWPMFEAGGTCYVYRSYGIHLCMNVATGEKGMASAVLLRAAAPVEGLAAMARRRGLSSPEGNERLLLSGPGRLTQGMGVSFSHNGRRFDARDFKLVDLGVRVAAKDVGIGPRIGITKAAALPLRFTLRGSPWLSRRESA